MQLFAHLSDSERDILIETPLYVGLLIAYADGEADFKELEWIEKVCFFRQRTAHHSLRAFYAKSYEYVKNNLNLINSNLPQDSSERINLLTSKISRINSILAKVDPVIKERTIESFKSLALSVAEISGGLMNFFALNPDEEKWLDLPMISHE